MKYIFNLILFFSFSAFAQESIEASLVKEYSLDVDDIVAIDNFGTQYHINNNSFQKNSAAQNLSYSNVQLGDISSANTFNPLKINVFYKDFNTVVILDNRLAEIFKIDFNTTQPYKNVTHVSTGHDNTLWLFNQDTQQLELFDYKTGTTRAKTLPIQSAVLDVKSNYNNCYLLTKQYLIIYNYFGSIIKKIKNTGYTAIAENNGNTYLKKENTLFYLKKNTENVQPIAIPNLLINQFFVTNETLYIYNNETLQQYQLKID